MAKQSIDPALLALQTAKNTMPASPSTQPVARPSLNVPKQQPQAISTNITPPVAKIGGISSPFWAPNINSSPVLWWATPQEIGTRAKELQSLPKAMPATWSETVKKLSIDDFANKIKEKYPEYKDKDNKILAEAMIKKYPEYQDKIELNQPTTTQNIAWWLVQSATWLPSLWAKIANPIFWAVDKYIVDPISRVLWVDESKIQANTARAQQARSNIIWWLETAGQKLTWWDPESTAFKTAKLIGDIGQTALTPTTPWLTKWAWLLKWAGQLALQWAWETVKYSAIADQRLPTKEELAYWVWGNVLLWWAFAWLPKIKDMIKWTPPDVNKVVWKIIQWKEKDIKPAIDALSQIDTKWIKTYKELWSKLREWNQKLMQSVDEILTKDTRQVTPDMFTKTVKAWDQVISKDYMGDVIDNLTELYSKWWDIDKQAKILNVKDLYKKWALKLKDANDLLRVYSSEFGDKAFSKVSQEPLTSVSAQQYENIRKWAKELLRSQFADDWLKQLDQAYSKSTKTLKFIDDMSDKVQKLQQKVQERWFIENITRKLWRWVDLITWWWVRWFLTSFLPSNIGNKVLNSLDLQEQLAKNLDDFAKAIWNIEKWTAKQVDLDLIKKYANSISTPSLTSMGKPPQVSK